MNDNLDSIFQNILNSFIMTAVPSKDDTGEVEK